MQLDIKRFNPTKITKFIVQDLLTVHDDISWWYHRIQFGIWDLNFLKYLNQSDYFKINLVKLINLVMINLIFLILVLIGEIQFIISTTISIWMNHHQLIE